MFRSWLMMYYQWLVGSKADARAVDDLYYRLMGNSIG